MDFTRRVVLTESPEKVAAFFRSDRNRLDKTIDGKTPLMLCLDEGRPEIARILIDLGANIHVTDQDGDTLLMKAARGGFAEVTRRLLSVGADVNAEDPVDGLSALDWALLRKHYQVAAILRQAGGRTNFCEYKVDGV